MDQLLTVHDLAKILKVSPKSIRSWIKAGKLAGIKLPNGDWRFKEEFMKNWIDRRTVKAKNSL